MRAGAESTNEILEDEAADLSEERIEHIDSHVVVPGERDFYDPAENDENRDGS